MAYRTYNLVLALALAAGLAAAPAYAQDRPVWALPTDTLSVVDVGSVNGLSFAKIRDSAMHGHNIYCVTIGAHIGKATVTKITSSGVQLSDGHMLRFDITVAAAR